MPSDRVLRSVPVQLIGTDQGVLLKRGATEFMVSGPAGKQIVEAVLAATSDDGASHAQICALFAPSERDAVGTFLDELVARRILIEDDGDFGEQNMEDPLEVFYWQFGIRTMEMSGELLDRDIAILGVNSISCRLAAALEASGFTRVRVVDFTLLRNLRLDGWPADIAAPVPYGDWAESLDAKALSCLVPTSDFGTTQVLREWNEFCIEQGVPLLPVVLQDYVGQVGPLVVPGETACYECLRGRQNAGMVDAVAQRIPESAAFTGQYATGFHPSMASILGDIAAIELLKFYTGIPLRRVGALIEVSLLEPSLVARPVLKLPRCPVCSPLKEHASFTPHIREYMHERQ